MNRFYPIIPLLLHCGNCRMGGVCVQSLNNIENVFLSIDEDDRHSIWREEVRKLQLNGYHIRLNSALRASVNADIFDGGTVSIPRYLLVDEQGRIISMNANRPAEIKAEVTRLFAKK